MPGHPLHPTFGLNDTDPEAARIQREIFRRMTPAQKIELVSDHIVAGRELARAGLRIRFPEADAAEIERRPHGLILGEELATKVYGPLPQGKPDP